MSESKFVNERFILRKARLRYSALWTPKAGPIGPDGKPGAPSYNAFMLVPADDPQVAELTAAARRVAAQRWGAKGEQILVAIKGAKAMCFGRGEDKPNRDGDIPEEYRGMVWINAGRNEKKGPPLVVDRDPTVHLTERDGRVYNGCYVTAILNIWPLDMGAGVQRRIVATLDTIQFVRDGDSFGGGRAPTADGLDDLSQEDEGAGATADSLL